MKKFLLFCVVLLISILGCCAKTIILLKNDRNGSLIRQKRQFSPNFGGFGRNPYNNNFGQSSSQAQANAFNNHFGPNGFGSSNAIAGAQSFDSHGPLGSFGASAANSASQGFSAGPGGINANIAQSGSQTYRLPNGQKINIAYGASHGMGNGQGSNGNSFSVNYSRK